MRYKKKKIGKSAILMDLRDLLKAFYYIRERGNASSSEEMVTNTAISPEMASNVFFTVTSLH